MQDIPSLPICPSSTKYHKNPMFTSSILMKIVRLRKKPEHILSQIYSKPD